MARLNVYGHVYIYRNAEDPKQNLNIHDHDLAISKDVTSCGSPDQSIITIIEQMQNESQFKQIIHLPQMEYYM